MKKKINVIIIIIITVFTSIIIGNTNNETEAASTEVYDVILFFGQSNMVGSSFPNSETRHIGRVKAFGEETATNLEVLTKTDGSSRIVNRARMDIDIVDGSAYEYIMYPNTRVRMQKYKSASKAYPNK